MLHPLSLFCLLLCLPGRHLGASNRAANKFLAQKLQHRHLVLEAETAMLHTI
jgi:hypothetical protein